METWELLIAHHRGLLTRADVSPDRLRKWAERGRLVVVLPGVYVLPDLLADEETLIRAVLAYCPDAVIAGFAAARRTFWPSAPAAMPLVVNAPTRIRRPTITFHTTPVRLDDTVDHRGIRLTSAPRTALDLATITEGRSIDEALRSGVVSLEALWETFAATPHRRGNQAIHDLLHDSRDSPWSADERFFHRALRQRGITGWSANQPVVIGTRIVYPDVGFHDLRLAIEVDGRHHRDDESTFQSDRERQNLMALARWWVLRYTGAQLRADMDGVLDQVEQMRDRLQVDMSQNRHRSTHSTRNRAA